jgi:hypothetical protein
MKKKILLIFLSFVCFIIKAQKSAIIDSTDIILKGWINEISTETYMTHFNIRGVSKELYTAELKLVNLSIEDYQKGKYQYALDDMNKVIKLNRFPEVERIKLFIQTMVAIKLDQHFKARKWYYVSQNKIAILSFARLSKNVENQKLPYKINNYRRVRGARITALCIGAGVLFILGTISGG